MSTPPPAIVQEAIIRCEAIDANGELPRILVTPPPDNYSSAMQPPRMWGHGVTYVRDPHGVERCVGKSLGLPDWQIRQAIESEAVR